MVAWPMRHIKYAERQLVQSWSSTARSRGNGNDICVRESRSEPLHVCVREIEPDQWHADIIVHELDLQDARPVSSAGEVESRAEEG